MKLRQLQVFLSVAEQGSLHGAARALCLTQPAVTVTIRELESTLGVPLIVRSVNGAALTEYGVLFQRRARMLVNDVRHIHEELSAMLNGAGGEVAVSVSSAVACALLPEAFTQFRAQNPDTSVTVRELPLPAALRALRDGDTDFAVVTGTANTQWSDFVERRKIMSVPLLVVARQGHPLAQARSMSKLHGAEWLLPCEPGDDIDKGFTAYFHSLGLSAPSRIMRCQALAPSIALISKTDMICLATQPTFQLEMKRRRIRELKIHESLPDMDVYVVQRRERPLTSAASRFLSCVEEAAMR
jgi:LysR family transcriptional regulator, regulator of abg operon